MINRPTAATIEDFRHTVRQQIQAFETALLIKRVADRRVTLTHYHALLLTIFHQTLNDPYTFAVAAANCDRRHAAAKEYLLRHAEEGRGHWRRVLADLTATGYTGADPRETFPHLTCEAYISFDERVANRAPIARLAVASVVEGIGAAYGGEYGARLLSALDLTREQGSFFLGCGEAGATRRRELDDLLSACELDERGWGWMTYAAAVAGELYRSMYDHEAFI